jgi:hypothetical protein
LVVFTFTMSNSETEGDGFWLDTNFFPGQLLVSQNDTWLWTVAVTDPLDTSRNGLSIAGVAFGPIAATATTTTTETTTYGEILTFGPW